MIREAIEQYLKSLIIAVVIIIIIVGAIAFGLGSIIF